MLDANRQFWIPREAREAADMPESVMNDGKVELGLGVDIDCDDLNREIFVPYLISNYTILLYDSLKDEKVSVAQILRRVAAQNLITETC